MSLSLYLYENHLLFLSYVLKFEDNLEREKKVRADTEKAKKKVEQDLRDSQSVVEELEGIKADLENNVKRWLVYIKHMKLWRK